MVFEDECEVIELSQDSDEVEGAPDEMQEVSTDSDEGDEKYASANDDDEAFRKNQGNGFGLKSGFLKTENKNSSKKKAAHTEMYELGPDSEDCPSDATEKLVDDSDSDEDVDSDSDSDCSSDSEEPYMKLNPHLQKKLKAESKQDSKREGEFQELPTDSEDDQPREARNQDVPTGTFNLGDMFGNNLMSGLGLPEQSKNSSTTKTKSTKNQDPKNKSTKTEAQQQADLRIEEKLDKKRRQLEEYKTREQDYKTREEQNKKEIINNRKNYIAFGIY